VVRLGRKMKGLNPAVRAVSEGIESPQIKSKYLMAFQRIKSKKAAIDAFCCMCVGFEDCVAGVRECTAVECPLWIHRPYRNKQGGGE